MPERRVLFRGCQPAVLSGTDGRIEAVGPRALATADGAGTVDLAGRAHPGFADSHIHLGWMARQRLALDLGSAGGADDVLREVRRWAERLPARAWVVGHSLDDAGWPPDRRLDAGQLDQAAAGRPVFLHRRDTHMAWAGSAALRLAGIAAGTPDPPGGVIDRDAAGAPTGALRENAAELVRRLIPDPDRARRRELLAAVLRDLGPLGITAVHAIESAEDYALLASLHDRDELPVRVSALLHRDSLDDLVAGGVRSGTGDDRLRIWGVKLFLDGSLGSDTAEMLDGRGVAVLDQDELVATLARVAAAGLNVAVHAIGDSAVRRALDAFEGQAAPGPGWRPRIEHAQCVDAADVPRFARLGVIASMQPVHAVSDRALADRRWGPRCAAAFAWRPLRDAGAVLAFGSDAPVDDPSPLRGIDAATGWRRRSGWHPDLALDRGAALQAYTAGAARAVGMEDRLGALAPGRWCDLSVVDGQGVVATVVGGELSWRR